MQHKKGGDKGNESPLDGLCRLGRLVIYRVTFERELFQTTYSSPVIVPDHYTLAPVYPHNIGQVPFLQESDRYREDVRESERQGRSFEPEYGLTLHIIEPLYLIQKSYHTLLNFQGRIRMQVRFSLFQTDKDIETDITVTVRLPRGRQSDCLFTTLIIPLSFYSYHNLRRNA